MHINISTFIKVNLFILVALFYSYITSYYATFQHPILNPRNLFLLLAIVTSGALLILNHRYLFLRNNLLKWLALYFTLYLIWYVMPTNHLYVDEFRKGIFALAFLGFITILISFDNSSFTTTRKAILVATIIAIINNILEFFNPTMFYSALSEMHIIGRSAGWYINSNIAGEAIVLGVLFSYAVVPNRFKMFFLLVAFVGIAVTFSRMGMLGWLIVVGFFIKENIIPKDRAIIFASIFVVLLVVFTPKIYSYLSQNFGRDSSNLINRLDFFSGGSERLDYSQKERIAVAKAAFDAFGDHPLLGAGLGYTEHWKYRVSTHNMYLVLMVQFGIIGAFLYPLLIYSAVRKARNEAGQLAKPFAVYFLMIGFTTHNVLDSYHLLIGLALMSNLTFKNK